MLKRVMMIGMGWLLMSLLVAGMTIPILSDPAEAAKICNRAGGTTDDARKRDDARDALPAPQLKRSDKPVESETPTAVRVLNTGAATAPDKAAAGDERARRALIQNGDVPKISPTPAAAIPAVAPTTAATVTTPVMTPVANVADVAPRPASNLTCLAGC